MGNTRSRISIIEKMETCSQENDKKVDTEIDTEREKIETRSQRIRRRASEAERE